MRQFQFRLEPLRRLKAHQIEEKENEMARLEGEIQSRLNEIEHNRHQVLEMRRRLMEDVDDGRFLQEERALDLFQNHMASVEAEKRREIRRFQEQIAALRKELIQLYQEDKMLERLREKRHEEWRAETQRRENNLLDEIGTQKFIRRGRKEGGAMMYLLVPLALLGAAAAIGWYTGAVDRQLLEKIPYVRNYVTSATAPAEIPAATPEAPDITYTLEDLLGETADTTMREALQNLADERERLRQLEQRLRERERDLNERARIVAQQETQLAGMVEFASGQIETLRDLERQLEERRKSELSEREVQLSEMIGKMSSRSSAPLVTSLYEPARPPVTPEEEEEARDNQKIVLKIMHRMTGKQLDELFSAISKENPETGARIISDFYSTSVEDLYDIETAGPAGAGGAAAPVEEAGTPGAPGTDGAAAAPMAPGTGGTAGAPGNNPLPPPEEATIGGG